MGERIIPRYLPRDNPEYLSRQLITYLGNKRSLLDEIDGVVCDVRDALGGRKLRCADLFSGSGVVARLLKRHSSMLYVNDLERYSGVINRCYLTNRDDFPGAAFQAAMARVQRRLEQPLPGDGLIAGRYAPRDDRQIQPGERVFYTSENARRIDAIRGEIGEMPEALQPFFLAPLLAEASVHNNTGGVFKGFYKDSATGVGKFGGNGGNALPRILGRIQPQTPVLSDFSCQSAVLCQDAAAAAAELKELDLVYLDPPYNQHPYGSNYFMLNLIVDNRLDAPVSRVSGIPTGWNRSPYNKQAQALGAMGGLIQALDSRYVLISYNSEGFITLEEMEGLLSAFGRVRWREIRYNTYRASRNLSARDKYVREYLFLLEKRA